MNNIKEEYLIKLDNNIYAYEITYLEDSREYDLAYASISKERKKKTDAYKSMKDKCRSVGAELLLKYILENNKLNIENYDYVYNEMGKPYLIGNHEKKLYFNISHSGKYVVCGINDKEIGLDVEKMDKYNMRVASRFFTEDENKLLKNIEDEDERKEMFFRLWTLKEAFIKYTGEGMKRSLSSFRFNLENDAVKLIFTENNVEEQDLYINEYGKLQGYRVAVIKELK